MILRLPIALAVSALSLSAVDVAPSSPAQAEAVLNRGLSAMPQSFDPQRASSADEIALARDLYEGLVVYGPKGEIQPGLAQSWQVSIDQLTWTFTMRQDTRWSSGENVTAQDVVFALKRLVDPTLHFPQAMNLSSISKADAILAGTAPVDALGVSAPNDTTVVISLARPTPALLSILAGPADVALSPKAVAGFGTEGAALSNGAFILSSVKPGQSITLTKNAAFHEAAKVQIDTVNATVFTDPAQCAATYAKGAVDFCPALPLDQLAELAKTYGAAYHNLQRAGGIRALFKVSKEPFNDVRIRQILALAIDRDAIAAKVLGHAWTPAYSLVPNGTAGDDGGPGAMIEVAAKQSEREDEARRVVMQTRFGALPLGQVANPQTFGPSGDVLKVRLAVAAGSADRAIADAVVTQWKAVLKADASVVELDAAAYAAALAGIGDYDVILAHTATGLNDPAPYLASLVKGGADQIATGWWNESFEAEMVNSAKGTDPMARAAHLVLAERLAMAELPVAPLFFPAAHVLVSPRITGWADNIFAALPAQYVGLAVKP